MDGNGEITPDDVADLNAASLRRTAVVARYAGIVVLVIAGLGVLAWLWIVARQQGLLGNNNNPGVFSLVRSGTHLSAGDRTDLFATSIELLLTSALLGGFGLGLRLVADFMLARSGGSLTGIQVGERAEVDEDEDQNEQWAP